ncbi:MAG TPA: DUF58 domain-containing protein [Gammaproteobacteria bacterium]|nr:DUF58 domain-containing protein [Gammaproteobacteria bacterium]
MLDRTLNRPKQWFAIWLARRLPPVQSLRLQQRHIFIVPTLTGVAFACALILMLLVAINYQNSLAYGLTFLLASVGLLSMFHTWRNLAGLTVSAAGSMPCFAGEHGLYRLRLYSDKNDYQAIAVGWHSKHLTLVDVLPDGEQLVELSLLGERRGWQTAPRLRIETRFPLGLFVAWSQVDLAQGLLVYPQPINDSLRAAAGQGDEHDSAEAILSAGVDDYYGLAVWQPGDSMRRINWKAWSKGQGLLVKQFTEQQGQQQVLDFAQLSGDVEYRLSVLCAQALKLSDTNQLYSLVLPGEIIGPDLGLEHRQRCLRALALYGVAKP